MARDAAPKPIITASEINEHAFCARSWWLSRVRGYASAHWSELERGRKAHAAHGRGVARSETLRRLSYWVLVAAVLLLAVGIASLLRGP